MTDSMDEWDGGAIDGRDQYIADAPYWSNGDGETVDATDNSEGQVTAENVPGPGEEPGADRADGAETDDAEVPTWPPNPETLTEIRRRLLNGASTYDVGEWVGVTDNTIRCAAIGESHSGVDADIPPLTAEGQRSEATWVINRGSPDRTAAETEVEPEPEPETETADSEEDLEPETEQQELGLVSGDDRPVARNPPKPETPTVPTRWLVAGIAFVAGWVLSRLVRGGGE